MKLEVGKSYMTRDGNKIDILIIRNSIAIGGCTSSFSFDSETGHYRGFLSKGNHPLDLISSIEKEEATNV